MVYTSSAAAQFCVSFKHFFAISIAVCSDHVKIDVQILENIAQTICYLQTVNLRVGMYGIPHDNSITFQLLSLTLLILSLLCV